MKIWLIILIADTILNIILSIAIRRIKKSTNKMIDDFVIEQRKRDGLPEVKYE